MTETCPCGATYTGSEHGGASFRLAHSPCRKAWQAAQRTPAPSWSPCPCDSSSHHEPIPPEDPAVT